MPKAPRRCPRRGCTNRITHTRYCPDHTKHWAGPRTASSRSTNTQAWRTIRTAILDRDQHTCQIRGPRCTGYANQVDKVKPAVAGGDPLDPHNLRAACGNCNLDKARTSDRTRVE